jgi:hypothetical protein
VRRLLSRACIFTQLIDNAACSLHRLWPCTNISSSDYGTRELLCLIIINKLTVFRVTKHRGERNCLNTSVSCSVWPRVLNAQVFWNLWLPRSERVASEKSCTERRSCLNASTGYFNLSFYCCNVLLQVHAIGI